MAVTVGKITVGSHLDDLTVGHHDQAICSHDRRLAMGNDNHRPALGYPGQGIFDELRGELVCFDRLAPVR